MKIQQFNGGLATRVEPQLLNTNEGTVYENIENSKGVLAPSRLPEQTAIASEDYAFYFEAEQEWISYSTPTDFLEFQRKVYFSDRVNRPQVYDGTDTYNLGIEAPGSFTAELADLPQITNVNIETEGTSSTSAPLNEDAYYIALVQHIGPTGLYGDFWSVIEFEVSYKDDTIEVVETYTQKQPRTGKELRKSKVVKRVAGNRIANITIELDKTPFVYPLSGPGVSGTGGDVPSLYRLHEGTYRRVVDSSFGGSVWYFTDNTYDISNKAELTGEPYYLTGTYQYVTTFYNSTNGFESGPSPVSDEVIVPFASAVELKNLPESTEPGVDRLRIYRVGGTGTTFRLVAQINNGNSSFFDTVKDSELGELLEDRDADPAPVGLRYLAEAYAMFFGALDNKLRFTPIGKPYSWPEEYFLSFDSDITGIAPVSPGVLVFTKFSTYIITGTGPTRLTKQLLSADQGCIDGSSVQVSAGTAIWASTDGICVSTGGRPTVLSKDKLGKIKLAPKGSAVHDQVYYLLDGNSCLAVDFGLGQIFKRFSYNFNSLAVGEDVLYGVAGGYLHELNKNTAGPATIKYTSPRFIEGSVTEHKSYKKVHIYHDGDIMITVRINNEVVATKQLVGTDATTVQVPSNKQRGFFIQFEFEGTGTVHEIEYEVTRGQSTK